MENITFLDPACGSGHFLIEAFDLYFRMYEAEGKYTDPETICKKILNRNLYGIDIDERAVQIARAALWMKAAERVFDFTGTPKNIIATNIRLPKGKDHLKEFLQKHPEDAPLQPALETIFEGLAHADELGSLLQIEEPVEQELRHLRERLGGQTTLSTGKLTGQTGFSGPMTDEDWDAWKDGVIERLADHFKEEAEAADLVNAFFSQNAGKGVRLFELLSKRYDVVAANPPYMGWKKMGKLLKKYIEHLYRPGKRDLYASFIIRCLNLCQNNGEIAMVTQQSWLFQSSYLELRTIDKVKKGQRIPFNGLLNDTSIQNIVHLGPNAFEEIGGEVVNCVLFTLQKKSPINTHRINCYRLVSADNPLKKIEILKNAIVNNNHQIVTKPFQNKFHEIPGSPICYWLSEKLIQTLSGDKLGNHAKIVQQVITSDNNRFLRAFWEVSPSSKRWIEYLKAGGYSRWSSFENMVLDWHPEGNRLKNNIVQKYPYLHGNWGWLIKEETFWREGWTYTLMAQGCLGVRKLNPGFVCDSVSPTIIMDHSVSGIGAILNCRIVSYLLRSTSSELKFRENYIARIPLPKEKNDSFLESLEQFSISLKKEYNSYDLMEIKYTLSNNPDIFDNIILRIDPIFKISLLLIIFEGISERIVFKRYNLDENDINAIISETGTPSGWNPLITNYASLPPLPYCLPNIPQAIYDDLAEHKRQTISSSEFNLLKSNLHSLYEAGPGAKVEIESSSNEEENIAGAYIPIPPDTFLEELSQKLKIHPLSVYWLLKEGIEQEGWRCIPEEQRITADHFTVMILRTLGHRWPKQIEAGEPVPDWADADGIIPLTSGAGEATLLERVRMRIAEEFTGGSVSAIEHEFEEVMGKSLEDWLHIDFFKHHTKQFKKRPIAWQVQSGKFTKKKQPAFACMVYYHKLDEDTLYKIKNQYVGPLRQKYETEMRGIEGIPIESRNETQEKRYRVLGDLITELKAFGETLTEVAESGFTSKTLEKIVKTEPLDAWCSIDGVKAFPADKEALLRQERSYVPDINDGVRVNVVPLQKAGLLAADVIAKKDLEKAVSDRAEWRADERRWCREGKLPKCGWWN